MQDGDRGVSYPAVAVAALVALAGVAVVGMAAEQGPSAETVVENVEQRYQAADSYVTTATVTVANDTAARTMRVRLQFAAPDRYRYEVLAPEDRADTVAGTNGTVAWVHDETTNVTQIRPLNESQRAMLGPGGASVTDGLGENYTAERAGTESVDGREAYVLELSPTNESANASATVWVDAESWTLLRAEATRTGERAGTATVVYESTTFNVSIHESAFEPPSETSVTFGGSFDAVTYSSAAAARANASVPVPGVDAPAGYTFERADVLTAQGGTTVTQAYTDGNASLLVVTSDAGQLPLPSDGESVAVGDRNATYTTARGQGVVYWEQDGVTYAVVGDLPKEDLLAVARSLPA